MIHDSALFQAAISYALGWDSVYDKPRLLCACGVHEPELPSGGLSRKLALQENWLPSQISGLHNSTKRLSQIWRKSVAVMKLLFRQHKLTRGIQNDEGGSRARCHPPLAYLAAGERRRRLGHPACEIGEGKTSITGFGPHQRQCD